MDKINEVVFARGSVAIGRGLWKEGDVVVIDGLVNGSARFIGWFAGVIRFLQSGYIYHYAFAMIIGMLGPDPVCNARRQIRRGQLNARFSDSQYRDLAADRFRPPRACGG